MSPEVCKRLFATGLHCFWTNFAVVKTKHQDMCEHHEKNNIAPIVVSAVMLAVGLLAFGTGMEWTEIIPPLLWYVVAFLPVGWGVAREAVGHALRGDVFNEYMLMTLASLGAFAIGEYPEAVAVMLLYQTGEMLQEHAVERVRRNISSMVALRPDRASVVRDGTIVECSPEQVATGEVIEVRPGERVPLDGELLTAGSPFDTSVLTGESLPRMIATGGEVSAGMIAAGNVVRLRVTRPAGDSAVARILRLVEEASARKAPTELFIRRFARVYTPVVFSLAVLVVLVPWLCSLAGLAGAFDFALWFRRALIFLVISCPCALVISVPLGYFAGIGAASRRGILFKGGGSIDAVADVDTVAFDKTGTLTCGRFEVLRVEELSDDDIAMVAAMERTSVHPVARAIMEYGARLAAPDAVPDVTTVPGYGLEAGGWLAGSPRLLERHGISVPRTEGGDDGTVVCVAAGGAYKGRIVLGDVLRDDARQAVQGTGLRTVILSGDRQPIVDAAVAATGAALGIGDLLPGGKAEYIESLRREGHRVAFVGDGINDAPVLAASDVGIAFGDGSADMAVETADIVIHSGRLVKTGEAIAVARRTRRIVKQNIVFAVGFKVLVMILGVLGAANIWMAVFADTGVALLAVLNSMRVFSLPNRHKE